MADDDWIEEEDGDAPMSQSRLFSSHAGWVTLSLTPLAGTKEAGRMWNEMWNEMCSIFFWTFPNSSMSFSRQEWNTLIGRGLLRYCIGRDHDVTTPAHLCHTAPTDWCPQHVVILGEFIAAIEWPPLQCSAEYVIKTCGETLQFTRIFLSSVQFTFNTE